MKRGPRKHVREEEGVARTARAPISLQEEQLVARRGPGAGVPGGGPAGLEPRAGGHRRTGKGRTASSGILGAWQTRERGHAAREPGDGETVRQAARPSLGPGPGQARPCVWCCYTRARPHECGVLEQRPRGNETGVPVTLFGSHFPAYLLKTLPSCN